MTRLADHTPPALPPVIEVDYRAARPAFLGGPVYRVEGHEVVFARDVHLGEVIHRAMFDSIDGAQIYPNEPIPLFLMRLMGAAQSPVLNRCIVTLGWPRERPL